LGAAVAFGWEGVFGTRGNCSAGPVIATTTGICDLSCAVANKVVAIHCRQEVGEHLLLRGDLETTTEGLEERPRVRPGV
jgi:hypothetical protein